MNTREKEIFAYTYKKVKAWFKDRPSPGHDFGHAERVTHFSVRLARAEGGNIFLSALSGLLHDVGRAIEPEFPQKTHHELSYDLCREWFRADPILNTLSRAEKLTILYAVRNHWNNFADGCWEAVILRDADKLDLFGPVFLTRAKQHHDSNWNKIQRDFRLIYDCWYWLRTKTAQKIAGGKNFIQWSDKFYAKLLRSKAKPVRL